jgi:hypothetical protein
VNQLYTDGPDDYLTPPQIWQDLGPFDLDPCCFPFMPWRTATRMVSLSPDEWADANQMKVDGQIIRPEPPQPLPGLIQCEFGNGLGIDWTGHRVCMNHPYSWGLPWARKMVAHGRGTALTAGKSTDTEWCQLMLANCSSSFWFKGRLLFHRPDGSRTSGKWLSNVLWAFGPEDREALHRFAKSGKYAGVLMERPS